MHREDGRLRVRTQGEEPDGFECDLLEMFGELLSGVTVNSFKPFPVVSHRPRITIDNLVVAREAWAYPAAELTWVSEDQEANRFLAARAWRTSEALPERVFYRTPNEDKPVLLDFGSVPLVNLFARAVRKAAEAPDSLINMAEMQPDVQESWLHDESGASYTAELRIVAVDPSVYQEGKVHSK
ncbi:lantibiotic dehydratase [Streptomyces lasalocidi]